MKIVAKYKKKDYTLDQSVVLFFKKNKVVLGFIVIILVVGVGIAISTYSMYLPFIKDIGDMKFYNMAYYGAQSSLERSYSSLRYHKPGFQSKGGRDYSLNKGLQSDKFTGSFGFFTKGTNSMIRNISSQTQRIPNTGETNLPNMFFDQSSGFNGLYYHKVKKIFLQTDVSSGGSDTTYSDSSNTFTKFNGDKIDITFRLNPQIYKLLDVFIVNGGKLSDGIDIDKDLVNDEAMLSWSFAGKLLGKHFQIYPVENIKYYTNSTVIESTDQMIRESTINSTSPANTLAVPNFTFEDDRNPILDKFDGSGLNVISAEDLGADTFKAMFTDDDYSDLSFSFNLVNFLQSNAETMYPFLEYAIDFNGSTVPNDYYTIKGEGVVGNFKVQIVTKKPTNDQENIASDFTIIF